MSDNNKKIDENATEQLRLFTWKLKNSFSVPHFQGLLEDKAVLDLKENYAFLI